MSRPVCLRVLRALRALRALDALIAREAADANLRLRLRSDAEARTLPMRFGCTAELRFPHANR